MNIISDQVLISKKSDPMIHKPKKTYMTISSIWKRFLAILILSSGIATITSAVLFFHMPFSAALLSFVISSVAFSTFTYGVQNKPLHSLVKEFFSSSAIFSLTVIQKILGKSKEKFSQSGNPILLIHGYAGSSAHFIYLKYCLKKNQAGALFTIDLGNPFLSIDDYAKKVEEKVIEIQKHYTTKITIIAHSMGGLIASRYIANCETTEHLEQMITIGSPLQGTYMAHLAIGKCARQMERNSPYLTKLEQDLANKNVPIINIGSTSDLIILPNHSSSFKTIPSTKKIFKYMGHASYLFSDELVQYLVRTIGAKSLEHSSH